jgi:fumarate hydratase class II
MKFRLEHDGMGQVRVPDNALFGAQTQRAVQNFSLPGRPMPAAFIRCLAQIKAAAAAANRDCGALEAQIARAVQQAGDAVAAGNYPEHFPLSVFQTGSGTSTNMNMNEVLARLASQASGTDIHPNDHVNCSQSSNDVIPSCIQVTAAQDWAQQLRPALQKLIGTITERSVELWAVPKTGRTHLMDAMPLTFGQELGAWACQLSECEQRFIDLVPRLRKLPIGGSAVGTGVNVPEGFPQALVAGLSETLGLEFEVAENPFSRMAGQEVTLECSSCLRTLAVVLTKISNDLRWMSSGPLSGLAEITLEPLQPGSSIMPGKINPVLPEAVAMVAADVIGNDCSVALACQSGNFQLNVMLPLIADKLCSGFETLAWACSATQLTVAGFTVNRARIEESLAKNPMLVTALNTTIGYEAAAAIARRSYAENRSVLDVAAEETGLSHEQLAALLDPLRLTNSGTASGE